MTTRLESSLQDQPGYSSSTVRVSTATTPTGIPPSLIKSEPYEGLVGNLLQLVIYFQSYINTLLEEVETDAEAGEIGLFLWVKPADLVIMVELEGKYLRVTLFPSTG